MNRPDGKNRQNNLQNDYTSLQICRLVLIYGLVMTLEGLVMQEVLQTENKFVKVRTRKLSENHWPVRNNFVDFRRRNL